jgi:predicted ribosome-associated RNA-binding protein Tma20
LIRDTQGIVEHLADLNRTLEDRDVIKPNRSLDSTGIKKVNGDYNVRLTDSTIIVMSTAIVTLPSVKLTEGCKYTVKNADGGSVYVQAEGSVVFDPGLSGSTTSVHLPSGDVHTFQSDGLNYWII